MPYTPDEVLAFLKQKRQKCIECGGGNWSATPNAEHGVGFFTVKCGDCGHTGLFNAMELIGKYGEYGGD